LVGHIWPLKVGHWFAGGEDLSGALTGARLIAPVVTTTSIILAPIKSRMEMFWYHLTWVVLENGR